MLFMPSLSRRKIRYIRNKYFLPMNYKGSKEFKAGEKPSVVKFIWSIIKGHRISLILISLIGVADCLSNFAMGPVFVKAIIRTANEYTGAREEILKILITPITIMLVIWGTTDTLQRIAGWVYNTKIDPTIDSKLKLTFLSRIMKNSYEFFVSNATGDSVGNLSAILWNVRCVIKRVSREIIPQFVTCCCLLISFLVINWQLGAIMLVYIVFYVVLLLLTLGKMQHLQDKRMKAYRRTIANITDVILNFASVIFFSRKLQEFERVKKIQNFEAKRLSKVQVLVEQIKIARASVSFILCGLIYTFLTFYYYQIGKIDLSDAIYAITASYEALALIEIVQEVIVDVFSDACSIKQGIESLNSGKMVSDRVFGGEDLLCKTTDIEFKDMSFSYEDNQIFDNLNLLIHSGEKIGLAGRSGAGKTTLINLILRNLYASDGKILIGGQNISYVNETSLKDKISIVSQDTTLFNRSVLENIRYSKQSATMQEVIEAAKLANAHDFIMDLEYGYDTNVGERGMRLSGGQRQRILIARAMLKNAPILILDEATSALDSETEKIINKSLDILMKGKTVIAIAHKLNTLKQMDRILVLNHGVIVQEGKHEDLLQEDGIYKTLWKIQSEGMILDD